jgi:lipopolysaccharide biosynthesis glycosyltransferase
MPRRLSKLKNIESDKESINPILTKNAWVVLLMGDPHYIIGAVAMAHSLRRVNTKYDIVCMTPDAHENTIAYLHLHFKKVYVIDFLEYPSTPFTSQKQNDIYDSWMFKSYTKWAILSLTDYKKVCIIDADLIVVNNMDHIFDLPTPVGVFSNHWFDKNKPGNKHNLTCNYYMEIKPGDLISPELIENALNKNGFVLSAHLTVLETSAAEYIEFKDCMKKLTTHGTFGLNNSSCHDEQSICYFQSLIKNRNWTCLKQPYNTIPWKLKQTSCHDGKYISPYLLHFNMTPKPWQDPESQWPDADIWWAFAQETPCIKELFKKWGHPMRNPIDHDCSFCIIVSQQLGKYVNCPPHTILQCPVIHSNE